MRRCLSTNVVTTAFKFGDRVTFEFFQRFLARCHNPKLGQPCTVSCVGHHKKPENIGLSGRHRPAQIFVLAMREIRGQDNHTTAEALGGKPPATHRLIACFGGRHAPTTSPGVYTRHTNEHQADCLSALQTVCASYPACAAACGPKRRDAHFRV